MSHVKTDNEDFMRDTRTRALINTNQNAYHKYKRQKSATQKLTDRIDALEAMIHEILKEKNG